MPRLLVSWLWVTSPCFPVMACLEGHFSPFQPALSPSVPPASSVSSLLDPAEVPCPQLLLGRRALDGRSSLLMFPRASWAPVALLVDGNPPFVFSQDAAFSLLLARALSARP